MILLYMCLFSFLICDQCFVSGAPNGHHQSRIVNGTVAADGEFPFVAQFVLYGEVACGVTIINENWVMTAAHCVEGYDFDVMYLRAGSNKANSDDGIRVNLSQVIMHENYNVDLENDIAVLKLEQPLTFGPKIQPVILPEQGQETAAGTTATVVGWGYTGSVTPIDDLVMADVVVWSDEDCHAAYENYVYPMGPSNICAGLPEGGRGQCNGDGGGPLLSNGYQVGIVSFSRKPCASAGYPGVFTEVSLYVDWIQEKTDTTSRTVDTA